MSVDTRWEVQISFVNDKSFREAYIPYTIGYLYDPDNLRPLQEKIISGSLNANNYYLRGGDIDGYSVVYARSKDPTAIRISNLMDLVSEGFGSSEKPLYAFLIEPKRAEERHQVGAIFRSTLCRRASV